MPTRKTVNAIVLKFLSDTNLTLKVDHFEGFNQSNITDFMINKTSRCNFRRKIIDVLTYVAISALNNKPYIDLDFYQPLV